MPWFLLALALVALASWAVTRLGRVSPDEARRLLAEGAVVLDVRSPVEFASQSIPGAINVPLDSLEFQVANAVPSKDTPVLLHCQSGGRSGVATRILRGLGYSRAFNLGSLANARSILGRG